LRTCSARGLHVDRTGRRRRAARGRDALGRHPRERPAVRAGARHPAAAGRVNHYRLHPVPFPDVAPLAAAFDELVAATAEGAAVDYDAPAPKWWLLHHLVRGGFVLHGSNNSEIEEFEPRGNFDAHNERHVEGVFASDDAIWPIYFATADRAG